jgi:hypothetical protein
MVMVVKLPVALKKACFWSFWLEAGLAIHFLGMTGWVMLTQFF